MTNLKSNIAGIIITTLIAAAGAIAILNYKNFVFWNHLDNSFDIDETFDPPTPKVFSGSIQLYKDFIMAAPITPENIRAISERIQLQGKIESAILHVKASPTQFGKDVTRKHTVYFYIDDGSLGGHLAAKRKNAQIIEGGFKIGDKPYELNIEANSFLVARSADQLKEIRLVDELNDNQEHWIGAFVATGIYGILNELTINYTCAASTPDCKIISL